MASDDWYRNTEWNDRVQEAFFAKLSRARSQRDQYLVIQANTLASIAPEVTLELVEFYFATRFDDFEDVRAHLASANAYGAMGKTDKEIEAYKKVLAREREFPGHQTEACFELPYLIALNRVSSEYEFAICVLMEGYDRAVFPIDHFKWHTAKALISGDEGRKEDAAVHAGKALEMAGVKKSGFRYHQRLGLVTEKYHGTLERLLDLTR
ncbi:MAG: hypothetical protein AAGD13_05740 [Pseudomonadota bacterium]